MHECVGVSESCFRLSSWAVYRRGPGRGPGRASPLRRSTWYVRVARRRQEYLRRAREAGLLSPRGVPSQSPGILLLGGLCARARTWLQTVCGSARRRWRGPAKPRSLTARLLASRWACGGGRVWAPAPLAGSSGRRKGEGGVAILFGSSGAFGAETVCFLSRPVHLGRVLRGMLPGDVE